MLPMPQAGNQAPMQVQSWAQGQMWPRQPMMEGQPWAQGQQWYPWTGYQLMPQPMMAPSVPAPVQGQLAPEKSEVRSYVLI